MRPSLLQIEPVMAAIQAELDRDYMAHRLWQAEDRDRLLAEAGPHVRAAVTGGGTGVSNEIIDRLPQLGLIAINGVGTDAVDLERARAAGIRVTNTPDVLTDDVADMALGLMLAVSRRLVVGDRFVRAGRWPEASLPLARKVTGKRLGILGLGRIGQAVASRAAGFGMTIAYHNRHRIESVPYRYMPSPEALAGASDILVVAAAGGAGSRGLVNRAVLDALGPEGVLINVARGSVVDEAALVAALVEGRLGGAGLDVFADEPHVPETLFALDNVVLQPHQASATVETRMAMGRLVLDNLAAFFAGAPLRTPVV